MLLKRCTEAQERLGVPLPSAKHSTYTAFSTRVSICFSNVAAFPPQIFLIPLFFCLCPSVSLKKTHTHNFRHFCTAIKRKTLFQFFLTVSSVEICLCLSWVNVHACAWMCVKVCKSLRVNGFHFAVYGRRQLVFQSGFPPFAQHQSQCRVCMDTDKIHPNVEPSKIPMIYWTFTLFSWCSRTS